MVPFSSLPALINHPHLCFSIDYTHTRECTHTYIYAYIHTPLVLTDYESIKGHLHRGTPWTSKTQLVTGWFKIPLYNHLEEKCQIPHCGSLPPHHLSKLGSGKHHHPSLSPFSISHQSSCPVYHHFILSHLSFPFQPLCQCLSLDLVISCYTSVKP